MGTGKSLQSGTIRIITGKIFQGPARTSCYSSKVKYQIRKNGSHHCVLSREQLLIVLCMHPNDNMV